MPVQTGLPVTRVSHEDTSLVSFILGVIDALQKLGTVPALDMNAYLNPLLEKSVDPVPGTPQKVVRLKPATRKKNSAR